jgi:hypothetical protein
MPLSLLDALFKRELTSRNGSTFRNDFAATLEESFASGFCRKDDYVVPDNVTSTISMDVSPDGSTFASTHGDHSVKVYKVRSRS